MPLFSRPLRIAFLAASFAVACQDGDDGLNAGLGVGDLRLLVATRDPAGRRLFDLQTLTEAFDSPAGLPAEPVEARADDGAGIFVTSFSQDPGALAFESETFKQILASDMEPGGFVAFDADHARIYTAGQQLAFFDAGDFAALGFPPIDLGGDATDVVYDSATRRIFVALRAAGGPVLRVFDAENLAEVTGSPVGLPGGPGAGTGDLLILPDRGQLLVAVPEASQLVVLDPATLRGLPRTPIALRAPGRELTFDPERERFYAGAADGRLESAGATDFALTGGFPRQVGSSVADLAFDPATQQLLVADSAARAIVVLDALTLTNELSSPIALDGVPVSVEVIDLR